MTARTNFPLVLALWGAGLGAAGQYAKISVIFDQLPGVYPDAGAALGFIVSLVGFVGILFGVIAGLLVGVESRSACPFRMPRDEERRIARGFANLYPVGEGAGYAGGIMSAAIDGARSAHALLQAFDAERPR